MAYIEQAQQDVIEKVLQIEYGFWDVGKMLVDGLLETGREILVSELKLYLRKSLREITPRRY